MIAISLKDISFRYTKDSDYLFKNINIDINKGDCVLISGPSGCGKSTLCHIIANIIPNEIEGILDGDILLYDKSIKEYSLKELVETVGIVFQDTNCQLFGQIVEDDLSFGPENLNVSKEEIFNRITNIVKLTNLEKHLYTSPNELSGGQQQLVALASILTIDPKIIIFDESLSQLDLKSKNIIKDLIKELLLLDKTIIIIDHNNDCVDIANAIINIEDYR